MRKRYFSTFLLILLAFRVSALTSQQRRYIKKKAEEYFSEAVKIRRHIHMYPELSNREFKTSEFVADYLKRLGLKVKRGIAKTGVVALIEGRRKSPVVALRADMDALPIQEKNNVPYRSRVKGVMHACGHDAHTTILLITAKILSSMKDQLPGTVKLIFQPAEEGPPPGEEGGAPLMIKEGVLENPHVDAIFALHVNPKLRVGKVSFKCGAFFANADRFIVEIRGKSSHAAYPHLGIDAIYAASLAVVEFQALVSRIVDPRQPAVLTVGKIEGGRRFNVLAEKVVMEGTVRTFSFETRRKIKEGMRGILDGLSRSLEINYRLDYLEGTPFVKNDERLCSLAEKVFTQMLGQENVVKTGFETVAEDFAYYTHRVAGFLYWLGVGNPEKGITSGLHTPTFNIDEQALKIGPALMSSLALEYLIQEAAK